MAIGKIVAITTESMGFWHLLMTKFNQNQSWAKVGIVTSVVWNVRNVSIAWNCVRAGSIAANNVKYDMWARNETGNGAK